MKNLKSFILKMFCKHKYKLYGWGYNKPTVTCSTPEDNFLKIIAYYKCEKCGKMEKRIFCNQFVIKRIVKYHSDKHIF